MEEHVGEDVQAVVPALLDDAEPELERDAIHVVLAVQAGRAAHLKADSEIASALLGERRGGPK